jgi:hypothetical protein
MAFSNISSRVVFCIGTRFSDEKGDGTLMGYDDYDWD